MRILLLIPLLSLAGCISTAKIQSIESSSAGSMDVILAWDKAHLSAFAPVVPVEALAKVAAKPKQLAFIVPTPAGRTVAFICDTYPLETNEMIVWISSPAATAPYDQWQVRQVAQTNVGVFPADGTQEFYNVYISEVNL